MNISNDEKQDNTYIFIERAIADTSELINYAAKKGIEIEPMTLETLINAKAAWENDDWSPEIETNFWGAYNQISRDVKPATITSIKAISHKTRPKWGQFFSASYYVSTIYTVWTLVILLIVLIFQIYWLIGNSLSTKLTELLTNETELTNSIIQADRDYASVEVRFKISETERIDDSTSGEYQFYNTPDWERETAGILSNRQKLENELEALRTQLERNSEILVRWATPWQSLFVEEPENKEITEQINYLESQIVDAEQLLSSDIELAHSVEGEIDDRRKQLAILESDLEELDTSLTELVSQNQIPGQTSSESEIFLVNNPIFDQTVEERALILAEIREVKAWLNQPNLNEFITTQLQTELDKMKAEKATLEQQQKQETTREKARRVRLSTGFMLIALQSYLLPVLYGLLGASVYVLRSIEQKITTVTFLPNNSHLLRLALGTIAGLVIGWFVSLFPYDSFTIPSSALAFVAGYNIEILFSQMDKIIDRSRRDDTGNGKSSSTSKKNDNANATENNVSPIGNNA